VNFELKFLRDHWKCVHCVVCIVLQVLSQFNLNACRQVCVSTT